MKAKLVFVMAWIFILNFAAQAKYMDGHVNVTDGVFVYTDVEWNTDVIAVNKLKNTDTSRQNIIGNEETIKYDMSNPTNEQKLTMMYVEMLQKARKEKVDLNVLLPAFIESSNIIITGDENLVAKRNALIANTTYKHENETYVMVKQKYFEYTDNILGTSAVLENGKYLINNIDPSSPKTFYSFFLVNSKSAVNCLDKTSDLTFDSNGFGLDKNTKTILKYDDVSATLASLYNVIDNSKEHIDSQLNNRKQYEENAAKAGNEYSSGGNWDFENGLNKSMLFGTERTDTVQTPIVEKKQYNIKNINVASSTKEGRGAKSIYYNGRNTLTNEKNVRYINLAEDPYNLSYGIYEVKKAKTDNLDYDKEEHIVFERPYDKSPTEMTINTANSSYILINFKLNKKDYVNSQIEVYKDGSHSEDLTIDTLTKDILLDVSDCSTVKLTVKPISKQIDYGANTNKNNIVFEPGKIVQNGIYSKNYVENNKDASNYYEYNDMQLYADMYLIF